MNRQILSRSERRLERKQVVILLILILAVALVSFALGVMAGRSGSGRFAAREASVSIPPRMPVGKVPTPAPTGPGVPADPPATPAAASPAASNLTFYDNLPRGEQPPLGSGINLPPQGSAPPPPSVSAPTSVPTAAAPVAPTVLPETTTEVAPAPVAAPKVAAKAPLSPRW